MACYQCGGNEGTVLQLCPSCIAQNRRSGEERLRRLEDARNQATRVSVRLAQPGDDRTPPLYAACAFMLATLLRSVYDILIGQPLMQGMTGAKPSILPTTQAVISFVTIAIVLFGAWGLHRWALWVYSIFFAGFLFFCLLTGHGAILMILTPAIILIFLWFGYIRF